MFIKEIPAPEGDIIKKDSENYNLILDIVKTQLKLMRHPSIYKAFKALLSQNKIRFIDTKRKTPMIDALVYKSHVDIFLPISIYMNQGFSSVTVFRKVTLAVIFGIISFVTKGYVLKPKEDVVDFMFSFYLIYLAKYQEMIIKDERVLALFNTIIVRYIFSALFNKDISKEEIKNYITHFDVLVIKFVYNKYPHAPKDSDELNDIFVDVGLMDRHVKVTKALLPYTKFQEKTLFAIERLNYLYGTLFAILFFSEGVFDDFLSKVNKSSYKGIIDSIIKFLSSKSFS